MEVRFYALLDPAGGTDSLRPFADRVARLLTKLEGASKGQLKITRIDSRSESNLNSAANDGIKAFNLEKGDACFLGLTVDSNGKKEALPRLSPDWEPAVEFDLARLIQRVSDATRQARSTSPTAQPPADAGTLEAVKHAVPNWDSVSLEEGKGILREASLNELAGLVLEKETRIKEAQQAFTQAQSPAEQEAARKNLLQLQTEQAEKVKQFMARSAAEIRALEQLKSAK